MKKLLSAIAAGIILVASFSIIGIAERKADAMLDEYDVIFVTPQKYVPNTPPEKDWADYAVHCDPDIWQQVFAEWDARIEAENRAAEEARLAEIRRQQAAQSHSYVSPHNFYVMGVIFSGGYRWTYYSQRVLPGGGLNIPGRHVDENGYVCDANGYLCVASMHHSKGSVISTPFGKNGVVYDYCETPVTLDIYVDW